jgi:hypothetical protein
MPALDPKLSRNVGGQKCIVDKCYEYRKDEKVLECRLCLEGGFQTIERKQDTNYLKNLYSNYANHIQFVHWQKMDEESKMQLVNYIRGQQQKLPFLSNFNVCAKDKSIYCWLRVIVEDLKPFSIVESDAIRSFVDVVDRKTISSYLSKVTKVVEKYSSLDVILIALT